MSMISYLRRKKTACGCYGAIERRHAMRFRIVFALMLLVIFAVTCNASWLVYHKPEFKGTVVDIDTDKPIEGAIVVAFYKKKTLNPPVEAYTSTFHVQEALTDKNGNFRISSYTTFINPFSIDDEVDFIILKPGYAWETSVPIEEVFAGKLTKDFEFTMSWNKDLKVMAMKNGTIKIPRVRSYKDRIKSNSSTGDIYLFRKQLPKAISIVEPENEYVIKLKESMEKQ